MSDRILLEPKQLPALMKLIDRNTGFTCYVRPEAIDCIVPVKGGGSRVATKSGSFTVVNESPDEVMAKRQKTWLEAQSEVGA